MLGETKGYVRIKKSSSVAKVFGNTELRFLEIDFNKNVFGFRDGPGIEFITVYKFTDLIYFSGKTKKYDRKFCIWEHNFELKLSEFSLMIFCATEKEHGKWEESFLKILSINEKNLENNSEKGEEDENKNSVNVIDDPIVVIDNQLHQEIKGSQIQLEKENDNKVIKYKHNFNQNSSQNPRYSNETLNKNIFENDNFNQESSFWFFLKKERRMNSKLNTSNKYLEEKHNNQIVKKNTNHNDKEKAKVTSYKPWVLYTKSDLKNETDFRESLDSLQVSKRQTIIETQQFFNEQKDFNGEPNIIHKKDSSTEDQQSKLGSNKEKGINPYQEVKELFHDSKYNNPFEPKVKINEDSQKNELSKYAKLIPSKARNTFGITYTSGSKGIFRVKSVGDIEYENQIINKSEPILVQNKTICPSSDQSKIFELLSAPKSISTFPTLNEALTNEIGEEDVKIVFNDFSAFAQEKDNKIHQPKSNNDEKWKNKSVLDYSFHEGNNLFIVEKYKTMKFEFNQRKEKLLKKNNMENVTKTLKKITLNEDILDTENIYCYYKEYVNQNDPTNQGEIIFTLQDES